MTLKELKIQFALGTLPKKFIHPMFDPSRTSVAIARRTCKFCYDKIQPKQEHYVTRIGHMNMCKQCIFISLGKVLMELEDETN